MREATGADVGLDEVSSPDVNGARKYAPKLKKATFVKGSRHPLLVQLL